MHLENHLGETFEIRIQGNVIDSAGETVDWWFHSSVIITESQKKRKTNLKFLCQEDLNLLFDWLKEIYAGNFDKTLFQFVGRTCMVSYLEKRKRADFTLFHSR
jgi:hypothetical protein